MALLVFLAATAGAQIVAARLGGRDHSGSLFFAPGETRDYGFGSPANGYQANLSSTLISPGVYNASPGTYTGQNEDNIRNDCKVWKNYGCANNSSMNGLNISYPTSTQAQVNFYGSVSNPLEPPLGTIRWNVTVQIDDSSPLQPTATVNYTTSCYPAHNVKVNGLTVFDSQALASPIPTGNSLKNVFACLTNTLLQVQGSVGPIALPPN